jgi:HEAT repeat protein
MDLDMLMNLEPWQWPEEAGGIFLQVLQDKQADPEDRVIAAELAGETVAINDDLAQTLLAIAKDDQEPEQLRGQALISLGPVLELAELEDFDDPDGMPITGESYQAIQATLFSLFQETDLPKSVRRCVLEAAVRADSEWLEKAVQDAYQSGDEEWKLTAVFCMNYLPGFKKQILEALNSDNEDIHYQAVSAAGNWELSGAWDHVSALALSPDIDKELRLAAIEALGTIEPGKSGEILADLSSDDDEDVAEVANEAMSMARGLLENDELDEDDLD